ncbi:MAG: hypothetical protein ACSHW0_09030 [Thalassotalea sp.]
MSNLTIEWQLLQNQYDSYEKWSLVIKLLAITLFIAGIALAVNSLYLILVMAVLWLQDGIWKTFQSRIEQRLYLVEAQLAKNESESLSQEAVGIACQFNTEFLANRRGGLCLIKEYICQALRPTVAYPYVLLLAFAVIQCLVRCFVV